MYTVHSNTIYQWFLSKTKPKLLILHRHRSRCLKSHTTGRITQHMNCACPVYHMVHLNNSSTGRQGVHVLLIHFRKAFESVDHKILLDKLAQMNVSRNFWLWAKSSLEGRTEQVNLQGALSFIAACPAGVPQGSDISPTLFYIHINDLKDGVPEQPRVNTGEYADDCTMDTSVSAGEPRSLQRALGAAQGWAEEKKMKLSAKKRRISDQLQGNIGLTITTIRGR